MGRTPEVTADVGVVELTDPIGTTDGKLEKAGADLGGPLVGTTGEVTAVDVVELDDTLGAFEAEPGLTIVALKVVETTGGLLDAEAVEFTETTGRPEEMAVPKVEGGAEEALGTALFDGTAIVAVLLGDKRTLVLVGIVPLETDIVVAFADEGSTVTVVVISAKAVPESVRSIYSMAVIVLV